MQSANIACNSPVGSHDDDDEGSAPQICADKLACLVESSTHAESWCMHMNQSLCV